MPRPGLFGLHQANRDFSQPESWGKNQFNSSFPAALVCYMGARQIEPVYLTLAANQQVTHTRIRAEALLGLPPHSDHLFFSFEDVFSPYADLVVGRLPRADLVTRDLTTEHKNCLAALEIKLTALPDNATADADDESLYGCEIVVRPDTVVYLALSLAQHYRQRVHELHNLLAPVCALIDHWEEARRVRDHVNALCAQLEQVSVAGLDKQAPLMLQPVWKTLGKKGVLASDCYDVFVWSNLALMRLMLDQAQGQSGLFTRSERAVVWLAKMLWDFAEKGKINARQVIDQLTYNTKNDKAFSVNGRVTHKYMHSPELTRPRLPKQVTREIILGGGQALLSPERRLDAIILNSPDLFGDA